MTTTYALDTTNAVKVLLTAQLSLPSGVASLGTTQPDQLLIQLDEYQPLQSRYQLVLKEGNLRSVFLAPYVYRLEQGITLELHVRPVRMDVDTVTTQRLIFEQFKKNIQTVFNTYRFDSLFVDTTGSVTTTYASIIDMKGWTQEPIPHGYGRQKEPLEMVARLAITVIYYEVEGSPLPAVGSRVVSVAIIGNTLDGLVDAEFEGMDSWVQIKIPKGPIIEQNLIGSHFDGTITTRSFRGLSKCLMETAIPENAGHYPINGDNSKSVFSTDIPTSPEFIITIRDTSPEVSGSGTKLIVHNFFNVRIKRYKMLKSSTQGGVGEPQYQIDWMADFIYTALN